MTRQSHWWLVVLVLAMGCSGKAVVQQVGDVPADGSVVDTAGRTTGDTRVEPETLVEPDVPFIVPGDLVEAEAEAEVPLGTPCNQNEDCGYGYCIEGPEGNVCTHTCDPDCPPAWTCKPMDFGGSDKQFVCVPLYFDLCKTCKDDEECGVEGDHCVTLAGEGAFCGMACGTDTDCPATYGCNSVLTSSGATVKQCVPTTGSCSCKAGNQGEKRYCENVNEFGTCKGLKTCLGQLGWSECDAPLPAVEDCDGLDNDCDGMADDGFADTDADAVADCIDPDDDNDGVADEIDNCPLDSNAGQYDLDEDGEGNACDDDDDGDNDPDETDCQPLQPLAHHGAKEQCDGLDNNCNGQVDEGYADFDKDAMADCVDPDDDNDDDLDESDCDALNPNVHHGALEACDGLDNDCNGKTDEGFPDKDGDGEADCVDVDSDGDGDPDTTDCAPFDKNIHSFAKEGCDGYDNNCNKQVDEGYPDFDLDGLANCIDMDDDNDGDPDPDDCAPLDPSIGHLAKESCDGYDNNCNGKVDEGYPNSDGDGEADCVDNDDDDDGDPDIVDCNPLNAAIHHGATEICDGQDNDCNSLVDEAGAKGCTSFYKDKDDDGWGMSNKFMCLCGPQDEYTASKPGDCDDSTWATNPDGTEVCNNLDDDCDGVTDNAGALGCKNFYQDGDGDGYGSGPSECICWANQKFTTPNGGDCNDANPAIHPLAAEICDNIDNNCDGQKDEGVGSTCGNCDPSCHQVSVGPTGTEKFTLDDENSSGMAEDQNGYLLLDKEQISLAFIWISNSGEYTVSKLDTITGKETGRYKVCTDPSRTAVDLYGDVWVACRGDGGVAKIHVYEKNCIDKNGDGVIQTSKDKNGDGVIQAGEMYPAGQDECIRFITYPGGSCQRAAGVDKENHAWIAEWNSATLRRLEPDKGQVVKTIGLPTNAYGLVIDGKGIIWISGRGNGSLVRVDPATSQVSSFKSNIGCLEPYGISLDYKGRVWIGNCCCWHVGYRFDPTNNTWAAAGTSNRPRGIAGASNGKVYVANDESSRVAVVNSDTMQTEAYVELGGGRFPVGMAVDFDGYVWAVNQSSSSASKIDPKTNQVVLEHATGSSPYTYSDMTGYMLHTYTQPQGYYQHVIPGATNGKTKWTQLNLNVTCEGQSYVQVRLRAANTVSALAQASWKGPYGPFPPNMFPMDLSVIQGLDGKYLQVEVVMVPDKDGHTPLLKGITVQYHVVM